MSYARFSTDDVYVFLSAGNGEHPGGWLECCGCQLGDPVWIPPRQFFPKGNWAHRSRRFFSTADLLAHLVEHRAAGHEIGADVFDHLREDEAENDAEIAQRPATTRPGDLPAALPSATAESDRSVP